MCLKSCRNACKSLILPFAALLAIAATMPAPLAAADGAEKPAATKPGLAKTVPSANAAVTGASHQFTFKSPAVGRTTEQDILFALELKATTVQGGTKVDEIESKLSRRQTRSITILAAHEGRVTKARVAYRSAEQEVTGQRSAGQPPETVRATQPISGKAYLVAREKPAEALTVTDEKGNAPSEEEQKLVANSMDAIGRDNVLGKFLDGRTIRVGHSVEMPAADANDLLGFDKAVGQVSKFELTLTRVSHRGDVLVGEFETRIELNSPDPMGQATRFRGKMVVEVDTCRSLEAEFAGPVSFVDRHGPAAGGYQVFSVGALRMRVATTNASTAAKANATPRR